MSEEDMAVAVSLLQVLAAQPARARYRPHMQWLLPFGDLFAARRGLITFLNEQARRDVGRSARRAIDTFLTHGTRTLLA